MENLTALYSFKGQEPQPLPERIRFSDGSTRTDSSTFTDEELVSAGFSGPYSIPPYNQEYQRLYWDSESLSYIVEDISDEELWNKIRERRNQLLSESDWTMTTDAPEDLNYREWGFYRQRLRDLPNSCENPRDVIWPVSPEGRPDSDFDLPKLYEHRVRTRIRNLEIMVKRISDELFADKSTEIFNELTMAEKEV